MSIYTCPHCGEKTFNPLTKALAGQMNSKGKACPKCGTRCVNGEGATIFNAMYCLAAFILVVITYLKAPYYEVFIVAGLLLSMVIVPRLVNAFCFKMKESIRIEI
ncbi:MAG: hypothetical protein IKQ90_03425 [Ruminococcus sp.]|nr:hypothetical protein [Ruminococcus sp.]